MVHQFTLECYDFLWVEWDVRCWSLAERSPVGWKTCPEKFQTETLNTSHSVSSSLTSSSSSYLLHFSLCLSTLSSSLLSILPCSNFPLLIPARAMWRLITILADISFHFSPHLPSYFWPQTPPPSSLTPPPHPPTIFFLFSPPSLSLQSFWRHLGTACFFQCSELMVEFSRPAAGRETEGTICSLCSEQGQLWSRVWSANAQACVHTYTHIYKHTHTHAMMMMMMMRPFPPSSSDPHLTANEKHDNYLQLFAPQVSSGNLGADMKSACRFASTVLFLSSHPSRPLSPVHLERSRARGVFSDNDNCCWMVVRMWLELEIWYSITYMGQWGTDKGYVEGNEQWIKDE